MLHPTPGEASASETDRSRSYFPHRFMEALDDSLGKKSYETINLYPHFDTLFRKDDVWKYAHKNDGHFNPSGYASFAVAVAPFVRKSIEQK